MPRFVRHGVYALLVLMCAACEDATAPQSVEEGRRLWESHNLTTYSYFGTQECFCGAPQGMVRVDVVDGRVSAVTDLTTHAQIPPAGWLTVEELFGLAEQLQPRVVEFDQRWGFPRKVERCCVADDSGSVYTVSSLYPSLLAA